jgi:serine/threonine protein kinase
MRLDHRSLLREIAELPLENEADVQRFFVPTLLRLLGYRPVDIKNERSIQQLHASHGRKRRLLAKPDFLVILEGRCVLAIDAKTPKQRGFRDIDVEQVFSYARHLSVQAPYCMLTNGNTITVYQSNSTAPFFTMARSELALRFRDLTLLLGKVSLGSEFGSVRLQKLLGSGGFGQVFQAWNPTVRRYEAVKIYPADRVSDPSILRRIRQGLKAHARLQHPQIAHLYWAQSVAGEFAVSMRFIEGVSLDRWISQEKPSSIDRLTLLAAVCDALAYSHRSGVFHRDLKPSNLMVEPTAEGFAPVLIDFDTAVVEDATRVTDTLANIGTLAFRDPHSVGPRRGGGADIYSLGALIYWAVTQESLPLLGTTYNLRGLEKRLQRIRDLKPAQVRSLYCIILHCIDPVVEARYSSVGSVGTDLASVLSGQEVAIKTEREFVDEVFACFDRDVSKSLVDSRFANDPYRGDSEVCRISTGICKGDLYVLYDFDYRWFMVGLMFDAMKDFRAFGRGSKFKRLSALWGPSLRSEGPSLAEQGGFYLQYPIGDLLGSTGSKVASDLSKVLNSFMRALLT